MYPFNFLDQEFMDELWDRMEKELTLILHKPRAKMVAKVAAEGFSEAILTPTQLLLEQYARDYPPMYIMNKNLTELIECKTRHASNHSLSILDSVYNDDINEKLTPPDWKSSVSLIIDDPFFEPVEKFKPYEFVENRPEVRSELEDLYWKKS